MFNDIISEAKSVQKVLNIFSIIELIIGKKKNKFFIHNFFQNIKNHLSKIL